jgi:hypothetical protein
MTTLTLELIGDFFYMVGHGIITCLLWSCENILCDPTCYVNVHSLFKNLGCCKLPIN